KAAFLAETLTDLDEGLRRAGGRLVLRRGDTVREVCRLVERHAVEEVHIAEDVSGYSRRREDRLREGLSRSGCRLEVHSGSITVAGPGRVAPTGKDHFAVFTPYHRRWSQLRVRAPLAAPKRLRLP